MQPFIDTVCTFFPREIRRTFLVYFIMYIYGKRRLDKRAIDSTGLTNRESHVYDRVRRELATKSKRERIYDFIGRKHNTKRLVNFFVVHYIVMYNPVSYYLNKTSYPYRIEGLLNQYNQPSVRQKISDGHCITWMNLHNEYKSSKTKAGRHRLHTPYARSVTVQTEDDSTTAYSLCELNFYLWLDEVGGIEVFERLEPDIRRHKKSFDAARRKRLSPLPGFDKHAHPNENFVVYGEMSSPYTPLATCAEEEDRVSVVGPDGVAGSPVLGSVDTARYGP